MSTGRHPLNPFDRYEAIADIAKRETDAVFGKCTTGPPFRHGGGGRLGRNFCATALEERSSATRAGSARAAPAPGPSS